jgi:hypothetical protein
MAIYFESNVTPTMRLDGPSDEGGFLKALAPKVWGDVGGFPFHYAPYGEPSGFGGATLAVLLILAAWGAISLVRGR